MAGPTRTDDAAKIEALIGVLRVGLPKLVDAALAGRDAVLRKFVADLLDAEWGKLKREEDQRRMSSHPSGEVKWDEVRRIERIKCVETVRIIYRDGAAMKVEGPGGLHRSLMGQWKKHAARDNSSDR